MKRKQNRLTKPLTPQESKRKWFKDILIASGDWGKGLQSISKLIQSAECVGLDYFYNEPIPENSLDASERLSSLIKEMLEIFKVKFAGRLVWGNSPFDEDDERSKTVCRKTPRLWFKIEE
jgi:hypothetical protein